MKKKIGIFTRPVDQGTSGSGHHLKEMILHFLKINDRFDVRFIHYSMGRDEIYSQAPDLVIPRNPLAAAGKINKHDFDLLHYTPLTIFSPVHFLNKKTVKVATMHGVEPLLCPQFYSRSTVLHEKIVLPPYSRMMDHVLTVSETSRNYYSDYWNVDRDRITICHNGIAPAYRVKERWEFERTLNKYGVKPPYLYHVSKYSERKNPWTMLKAFSHISSSLKDLTFVISGKGWQNKETNDFIAKNDLGKRIIFTDFTPEEDVVDFMNGADLFLFPSFAEGFGMPNVEAMACGCPVITSGVFAIPEIVGDAAHCVKNPGDEKELSSAILELLGDEARRESLRQTGFQQIRRYNWEESARTMYNVYSSLLS